jgi:hypothetical protein
VCRRQSGLSSVMRSYKRKRSIAQAGTVCMLGLGLASAYQPQGRLPLWMGSTSTRRKEPVLDLHSLLRAPGKLGRLMAAAAGLLVPSDARGAVRLDYYHQVRRAVCETKTWDKCTTRGVSVPGGARCPSSPLSHCLPSEIHDAPYSRRSTCNCTTTEAIESQPRLSPRTWTPISSGSRPIRGRWPLPLRPPESTTGASSPSAGGSLAALCWTREACTSSCV